MNTNNLHHNLKDQYENENTCGDTVSCRTLGKCFSNFQIKTKLKDYKLNFVVRN